MTCLRLTQLRKEWTDAPKIKRCSIFHLDSYLTKRTNLIMADLENNLYNS